jgi:Ni,Fe-hydrogenase III small subunit
VAENQANAPDAAQEAIETVELVGEVKSQADETVQTVEPEVTEAAQQTEVIEEPLLSSVSSAVENSSAPSASSVVQNSSAVSASSAVKPKKARSVAIFPMNLGGTNGARMELEAIFVPPYNAARYGISMTTSPKHADIIFLFGNGTIKMLPYALELLASLPDDVKLVVLGSDGPIARDTGEKGYMVRGLKIENVAQPTVSGQVYSSIDEFVLPPGKKIAAYITGSPPDPQSIINFILQIS